MVGLPFYHKQTIQTIFTASHFSTYNFIFGKEAITNHAFRFFACSSEVTNKYVILPILRQEKCINDVLKNTDVLKYAFTGGGDYLNITQQQSVIEQKLTSLLNIHFQRFCQNSGVSLPSPCPPFPSSHYGFLSWAHLRKLVAPKV